MPTLLTKPKTAVEMLMGDAEHDRVELEGGPLDGRSFHEVGPLRYSHNPRERYLIGGAIYRPDRMRGRVLILVHVNKKYKEMHRASIN